MDEKSNLKMNLYDLNKSIINQMKPLTSSEFNKKISLIEDFHNKHTDRHYMLLCKEYSYYTLFEDAIDLQFPTFAGAVCDIIHGLGEIMSLEMVEDNSAIEIWIRPEGSNEVYAFYLFPYDTGVVYHG